MQISKIIVSSSVLVSLLSPNVLLAGQNSGSFDPFEPDRPTRPTEPSRPSQPSQPSQPSRPSEPSRPSNPGSFDPWEQNNGQIAVIERSVRQYHLGNNIVDLLQDFGLRRELENKELVEVGILASTEQGNGVAQLRVNRLEIGYSQTVRRDLNLHTFAVDPLRSIVGRDIFDLELNLRGRFFIDRVIFKVKERRIIEEPRERTEVIRQIINQTIQSEGGVTLDRVLNLAAHQGKTIKSLSIRARALRGSARAQLLVNNMVRTEAGLSTYTSDVRLDFFSRERLGIDVQSLRAVIKGNAIVEEVILELESRNGGNIPGPVDPRQDRRIERVVNTRLYDNQTVELRQLVQLSLRQEDREVESVELLIRSSDFGARIKACQKIGSYGSITCGAVEVLRGDLALIRLQVPMGTKARELALQVRNVVDLERITVDLR